jgi:hypothetical protein
MTAATVKASTALLIMHGHGVQQQQIADTVRGVEQQRHDTPTGVAPIRQKRVGQLAPT